jgi:tetratricopeptide (TPR) repeat protein
MKGTTAQGLQELEEVLEYARTHDFIFEEEAFLAYAFLRAYLNNQVDNSWKTLQSSSLKPRENPLAAYAMALVAMRAGKNEEAITLLREAPQQHYPFWQREYLLGVAKLRRLDSDAWQHLNTFLQNYQGENGVKEGYQKMAWYYAIQNNNQGYLEQMQLVQKRGEDQTEPDKVALREARMGEIPDQTLLKARLLFDGGYYQRAYDLLKNVGIQYESNTRLHLEYQYRLGRIYHKMGRTTEAIRAYQQTIEKGEKAPWYFACNAALQLGLLYEEKHELQNAERAFRRCLGIKPEEYSGSLHGQAKAGLGRIKN